MSADGFDELVRRHPALAPVTGSLREAAALIVSSVRGGGKLLVCGNGGSAGDADHIVGELMKGMTRRRPLGDSARETIRASTPPDLGVYLVQHLEEALPAINLAAQSSLLTAVGNDTAGDMGFAQQVYGYGRPGDVLWALSTSGRSRNVLLAAAVAKAVGVKVLALTGDPGEPLGAMADVWIRVPGPTVQEAQELHLPAYHAICEAVENELFPASPA